MIFQKLTLLILAGIISGCAPNMSPQSYSAGSVGQINRTIAATVITAREVDITGSSALGGAVGAGSGAVAGTMVGGNSIQGAILGGIGGAVIGGVAGAVIESNATKQKGIEYIVETSNGNLMTIVQGINPMYQAGQKVFVLYGSPSRLVLDPR